MNRRPLLVALVAATILQVAMVVIGHANPAVAALFAVGGMGISLIGGVIYALMARTGVKDAAIGGAVAGGASALIGIAVSYALGDVEPMLLALGTLSSAVAGVIGAVVVAVATRNRPAAG